MKKIMMMAAVCLMAAMTFAAQCAATTRKGTQCKRQASPGSEFCWQHGGTTKAERAANGESEAPKRKVRRAGLIFAFKVLAHDSIRGTKKDEENS